MLHTIIRVVILGYTYIDKSGSYNYKIIRIKISVIILYRSITSTNKITYSYSYIICNTYNLTSKYTWVYIQLKKLVTYIYTCVYTYVYSQLFQ